MSFPRITTSMRAVTAWSSTTSQPTSSEVTSGVAWRNVVHASHDSASTPTSPEATMTAVRRHGGGRP